MLAFRIEPTYEAEVFDNLGIVIFFIDVVLNFFTGYYSSGTLVLSKRQIAIHYIKFWFWLDLVASFPYDIVITAAIGDDDES